MCRVNFKKNEKTFNPANSEVFKMVLDMDRAPREPEPGIDIDPADASPAQKGLASRTIQSRTFQRIAQQTTSGLDESAASKASPINEPSKTSVSPTGGQHGRPTPAGRSRPHPVAPSTFPII